MAKQKKTSSITQKCASLHPLLFLCWDLFFWAHSLRQELKEKTHLPGREYNSPGKRHLSASKHHQKTTVRHFHQRAPLGPYLEVSSKMDVKHTTFWGDMYIYWVFNLSWLVLKPPPCCSFARHLAGKMDICFSFAHLLIIKHSPV